MAQKMIDRQLAIRRIFLILCDIVVIIASNGLGLLLRLDLDINEVYLNKHFLESVWTYIPINLITTLILFYLFKLYHSLWRYAGLVEMQNVFCACILSSIFQFAGFSVASFTGSPKLLLFIRRSFTDADTWSSVFLSFCPVGLSKSTD